MLLSANVGFLAINSIDVDSPNKSAAQIASYISAILSLFIYIVCQILARYHCHHMHAHAGVAVGSSDYDSRKPADLDAQLEYITKREKRLMGWYGLAITFR